MVISGDVRVAIYFNVCDKVNDNLRKPTIRFIGLVGQFQADTEAQIPTGRKASWEIFAEARNALDRNIEYCRVQQKR
jgi:hypothetical protein